jgi:hypothetical protein
MRKWIKEVWGSKTRQIIINLNGGGKMNKKIISLAMAGMIMLFSAGSVLAADKDMGSGRMYRGMEKEEHVKSFPQGHPVTKNSLNRCFWDEKDGLFFCQYPIYEGGAVQ